MTGPPPPEPYPEQYPGPYGPPQPFGQPPYPGQPPYGAPQQSTSGWAVASLVFGVIGGVLISVVCGIVALNQAKKGRGGRGLAIAGLALSALWVLIIGAVIAYFVVTGRGSVDAADVKVGDCMAEIPDGSRVASIEVVTCDKPHRGEVFTILTMPQGGFPGQPALAEYQNRCGPALAGYAPGSLADPGIGLFVLYPTEESWERGDRAVTCIATSDDARTGTLRG